jgi:mannan endo-1,4-beta-mannosidase
MKGRTYVNTKGAERVVTDELLNLSDGRPYVRFRGTDQTTLEGLAFDGPNEALAFADRLKVKWGGIQQPAPAPAPAPSPTPTKVRWGAWIGNSVPWNLDALSAFETKVGKPYYIHFSSNFSYKFDSVAFKNVKDRGAVPVFSWAPTGIPIADVANGKYDTYMREWATAAKLHAGEIVLKFSWEMNGTWFSWTGQDPAVYKAMWTRAHGIFQSVGATNVKWHFCPNVDPYNKFRRFEDYYPGNAFVDYIGADGYNQGGGQTFEFLFATTYDRLRTVSGNKPFIVGETACTEATSGVSKADWITAMFKSLPTRFPGITGLVWFHKVEADGSGHSDWVIDSSAASLSAFKAGIAGLA